LPGWQFWQNDEVLVTFKPGLSSVELCIQPELWQVELVQVGELLVLWFCIDLLYAAFFIAPANAVLEF
jgi:hypothetical protein